MTFESYCKEIARHRHAQGFKAENNPLRRGFLYDHVLHVVDAFLRQTDKKILILNLPQKGGKSLVVNYLTSYLLSGLSADCKVLRVTNTEDNAIEHQQNINDIYNSEENTALFPYKPSKRFETKSELVLNGQYKKACKSYSVNSTIDGKRTNFIVIDDVYKNFAEAQSPTTTDKIMKYWKTSLYSRLENENSKVVICGTRYTKGDFYARIVNEYSWALFDIITIPAVIDGVSFCESVMPLSELMRIKSSITEDEFNALYLQNPTAETLSFFSTSDFTFDDTSEARATCPTFSVSDPSFGVGNNMFVCAKIVSHKGVIYVVDIIMSSQLKEDEYFKLCKECDFNLIEGNGIGGIIMRHANEQGIYNIEKFNSKEKLEMRIFESKNDVMGFIFDEKLKDNRLFTQAIDAPGTIPNYHFDVQAVLAAISQCVKDNYIF